VHYLYIIVCPQESYAYFNHRGCYLVAIIMTHTHTHTCVHTNLYSTVIDYRLYYYRLQMSIGQCARMCVYVIMIDIN